MLTLTSKMTGDNTNSGSELLMEATLERNENKGIYMFKRKGNCQANQCLKPELCTCCVYKITFSH